MTAVPTAADFETHRPRLLAVAYRLLGSANDAEDAVQDAFLRWAGADRALITTPAVTIWAVDSAEHVIDLRVVVDLAPVFAP